MNAFIYLTFGLMIVLFDRISALNLGCNDVRGFVDSHNQRRSQVAKGEIKGQPSASEMKTVIWDPELYAKASAWAAKNERKHNPDRTVPSGRFGTGENLFWISTTNLNYKLNPAQAVEAWFNEHYNYTYGPLKNSDFDGSKSYQIGHYTQLVWSESIFIGCGASQTIKDNWNTIFVVCNYGPTGNYLNQVPYKKGGPVSKLTCGCKENDKTCNCNKPYGNQC